MNEPALDKSRLLREIRENEAFDGFFPTPEKPCVLVLHNLSFVSGLYSTLIGVKSFLDLYARLAAKLLVPSANVFGFNQGTYKGRKVAGGRFLQWLDCSTPHSFEGREELLDVLLRHIDLWAGQAVDYRDAVVHRGAIDGITEAFVPLEKALGEVQESDVVLPRMPDGEPVSDYCWRLLCSVREAASETLRLLPDVDIGLLSAER